MGLERTFLYAESWNVAWREAQVGSIITDKDSSFNVIKNNFRYWAADPFLFEYQGKTYIFAELYDYIRRRGVLGYCELKNGKNTRWKPVIKEKYHLSYPYIVKKGKDIFVLPEAGASNSLYYYRAIKFPEKWVKERILRDNVKFADTTPIKWKDNFYGLAYDVQHEEHYCLWLLDFEDKEKDQKIIFDSIGYRRPAGKVFKYREKNIRPAQNCENQYGEGLIFYEYHISDKIEYSEKEICRLFPEDLNFSRSMLMDGMHTYNSNRSFEVIDIKTRRFNILNFISRVIGKIK